MNPKILKSLIILLSSLLTFTFIVDADKLKTCTKTKTYSETKTLTESCGTLIPGQTIPAEVCPSVKDNKERDCKGFIKTTTVTCTPTTTVTTTCPPIEECCKEGGKGYNNQSLRIFGDSSIEYDCPNIATNAVDCCKCCYEDPYCEYWNFHILRAFCTKYKSDNLNCSVAYIPEPFFLEIYRFGIIGCDKCRGTQM